MGRAANTTWMSAQAAPATRLARRAVWTSVATWAAAAATAATARAVGTVRQILLPRLLLLSCPVLARACVRLEGRSNVGVILAECVQNACDGAFNTAFSTLPQARTAVRTLTTASLRLACTMQPVLTPWTPSRATAQLVGAAHCAKLRWTSARAPPAATAARVSTRSRRSPASAPAGTAASVARGGWI